ncbi:hypothetical protein LCGC14_1349470, partial [marine sediment metagenome]
MTNGLPPSPARCCLKTTGPRLVIHTIAALRDHDEEDPLEVQAQELGINNYVKLSGNIGCVVNGAGLAMSTMDAIK